MWVNSTALSWVRAMSSSTGTTPGSTSSGGPSQGGARYWDSGRQGGGAKMLIA